MSNQRNKGLWGRFINVLTLFASTGTLLCCALPAAIAALLGTTALFTVIDSIPFIVTLSDHKGYIFIVAGVLLAFNVYNLWYRVQICPITAKEACGDANKFSKVVTIISIVIVAVGAYTAYLMPLLF